MKRFHIAIAVAHLEQSIADYSKRLGCRPQVVIPEIYALWRTETVNFSIRKTHDSTGTVRRLGWEDSETREFTEEKDINGITWEYFNEEQQLSEIYTAWPQ